ncbi:stefin-C-like [Lingula anatina]|uniref:Stefin-C-like n=1 Tax=Lingula anatina TaxID=7574 RepID=A0A1S3I373_LINAN|nr:stefin-C-like [Lingula anatina]|eukprot:XP_013391799.1 stefin-C-like [Lingula anatina]
MSVPGGASEVKDADADIQKIVDGVKAELEGKVGKNFTECKAISYRSQVVAGTNYFVKVQVGDEYIHVRIFVPLPHTGEAPSVHSFQAGKSAADPIEYF